MSRVPDTAELWRRLEDALASVPDDARQPPPDARVGAVLVLFEDSPEGPRLVFTRRRRDLPAHPGQLSFPGGRVDEGETTQEAALREAREEIGLDPRTVEVAGTGRTFYIPPSRFWVVPVVARWVEPHPLDPNPWEVDEVLHVPLSTLLDEERWRRVPLAEREAMWAWQLEDDLLWGATAVMVVALLETVVEGWRKGVTPAELHPDREVRPWEDFPLPEPRVRLAGLPDVPISAVPTVTADEVRAVERLLREDARVDLAQLLEHAGRAVADAVRRLAGGDLSDVEVTVLTGSGGTGAAGLAAARLLSAAGARVRAVLVGEPRLAEQAGGLEAVGVEVTGFTPSLEPGAILVDAMVGVGVRPPVGGEAEEAIAWLRRHDVPVVAVDVPSGIHPDEGMTGICVAADVTIALGAPKPAHRDRVCLPYVGDLYLADLGIPGSVWRAAGVEPVDVFGRGPLVRLVPDEVDPATETGPGPGPGAGGHNLS